MRLRSLVMEYKLEEIAEFQKGYAFKSKDYINSGICKIVKVSDLTKNSIEFSKCVSINESDYEKYERFSLNKGDIIITTVGSWQYNPNSVVGKIVTVPDNSYKLLLNQNNVRLRAYRFVKQEFLYYSLIGSKFSEYILNTAQGSANQASITQKDIKSFYINVPDIKHQKKIISIPNNIDKKIEINNKIIENLEAQAQAIFKSWFVDFEPFQDGNFVESELGLIPEGWEVKEIKEISDRKNGYTYKSSDLSDYSSVNMVTIKNFNRHGGQNDDAKKPIKNTERVKKHHILEDKDILVACTDLTQAADIIGRVILYSDNNYFDYEIYSMDVVKLVPHDITDTYFIYRYLNSNIFKGYAEGVATGTTVLHFPKKSIDSFKLIYPSKEHIEKFNEIIKTFIELENLFRNENYTLAQTRDTLLPKLMSGEIDVSNIKIDDEDIDYE